MGQLTQSQKALFLWRSPHLKKKWFLLIFIGLPNIKELLRFGRKATVLFGCIGVSFIFLTQLIFDSMEKDSKNQRRKRKDEESRDFLCKCGKSYLSYAAAYTHVKNKHKL